VVAQAKAAGCPVFADGGGEGGVAKKKVLGEPRRECPLKGHFHALQAKQGEIATLTEGAAPKAKGGKCPFTGQSAV